MYLFTVVYFLLFTGRRSEYFLFISQCWNVSTVGALLLPASSGDQRGSVQTLVQRGRLSFLIKILLHCLAKVFIPPSSCVIYWSCCRLTLLIFRYNVSCSQHYKSSRGRSGGGPPLPLNPTESSAKRRGPSRRGSSNSTYSKVSSKHLSVKVRLFFLLLLNKTKAKS